ncbi:YchF/TatD family DNA exonuclease [Texas Phoenix palm phytoplasma]|uniref:YchF/TatD family DNA exonuclease n=1 Tax=Texas Phoenix palm phytoplasma TaxID=176709 RepID=A0ABS5BIM5_9MOLU|nr:TatD family hydrolase [Texas Phoenix palm phytoplasma]MBP3059430.1 YchF/TatD family DNA exonuclease [Texas Phoenix palm phytoplasma]
MLIDTHAHLNLNIFENELEEIIKRAFQNNVKYFIVPGLNEETNQKAIILSRKYSCIKAALGIHPCYWLNEEPLKVEKYLKNNNEIVAIGEIGLDLYHENDSLPIQKKNLKIQIELALKYNLPIILHARESFNEIMEILLPYKGRINGVFHCLTTRLEEVKKAIELGFYVGLGGIITYEKAIEAHKIVKYTPLDKILLETDSPFLTPFPIQKNKRNEPSFIKIIAERIAFLKKISFKKVCFQTTENAKKLFKI